MRSVSMVAVAWVALFVSVAGCSGGSPGNSSGNPPGSTGGLGGIAGPGASGGQSGAPADAGSGPATGGVGGTGTGASAGGPGAGGAAGAPGSGTGGQGQTSCPLPVGPSGSWVEVAAPSDLSNFKVTDAFAVGTNDLLFAGSTMDPTSPAPSSNAQLLRWTKGCWTVELTFPTSTTSPDSPSVHGTGPNDIWATAGNLIYHRDAAGWTAFADETWRGMVPQPSGFFGDTELYRVRAAAAGDFWVAATSNVLHWSGGSWTSYDLDDPGFPQASQSVGFSYDDIWIDSTSSVWVVGFSKMIGNTMGQGFVHHFDGATWTNQGTGLESIYAIWRGGAVLWLAQPTIAVNPGETFHTDLLAFDGTNALGVHVAGIDPTQDPPPLSSLFGRGASDVWAAGADVAHFDGQGWSLVSDVPAAARDEADAKNTLVTGDDGSVWLVTTGPHFFREVTSP